MGESEGGKTFPAPRRQARIELYKRGNAIGGKYENMPISPDLLRDTNGMLGWSVIGLSCIESCPIDQGALQPIPKVQPKQ